MLKVADRHMDVKGAETRTPLFSEPAFASPAQDLGIGSILRDGFVTLSASQAAIVIRECRYERQHRDLTAGGKTHIGVLADIMRRNQWRKKDKLDFASIDGRLVILNGHHRLSAQAVSGATIEWTVVIHPCATEADLAALYYTFDTNQRARTNANILEAARLAEDIGVNRTAAEALWRAVPLLAAEFDFARTARDPLADRVIDRRLSSAHLYAAEIRLWADATGDAPAVVKKRLASQGALAVALTAYRFQRSRADEFYRGVAGNDGLRKGDPRHTYLRTMMADAGRPGDSRHTAGFAARAWNAWYAGKELHALKIVDSGKFRIAGTPIGR